ncbi:hypothetical protein ACAG26_16405 [Mycobacterium sp. pUA109]
MPPQGQPPYWGGPPPPGPYPHPPPGTPVGPSAYPPHGWPTGPYPPGPPPRQPGSMKAWVIATVVAVLLTAALVVTLVFVGGRGHKSAQSTPSSAAGPSTSAPDTSAQTATDCTPNVSAGLPAGGDSVSAGGLSFPASAAPGWTPFGDDSLPNAIDAVGVAQAVFGASHWIMQAEVAESNFVTSMDIQKQASKLMTCVANGPGYAQVSPSLGPIKTSSIKVDGTDAARVDADITIGDASRNVPGDSVIVIAVKTTPVTFFLGATPIGDASARATVEGVISALKVTK